MKAFQRELIIAGTIILITVIGLVPLVYAVGNKTLGPYGEDGTLGKYVGDVFGALAKGDAGIWFFIATPLIAISIVRLGIKVARQIK
ncbi:MAG: hypothetical protein AAF578_11190 [Pseudomonadota bacterium]